MFTGTPGECEDPFQPLPRRKLLPMRRTRLFALVLVAIGALMGGALTAVPAAADPPEFTHLDPGGQPRLVERLPVNVVFIGYDNSQVNPAKFFGALPRSYEPVVRRRLDYGVKEPLGITYKYDYKVRFTDKAYQNKFFGQLKKLAKKAPLTTFQTDYNDQNANARIVADNHHIDAPSVEKWLAYNPPGGVDTRRNTVYLINWYGRSDFVHHVYTKTDEPDPDTGYNFGVVRDSRKLVAWGGTTANDEENGLGSTRRVWFHDLSAGPESWAGNWNVDDADLDGDDEADYRIPVAWEYGAYRPKAQLTGDLAKLVRYVALDLLFTTSPLYPVELPTQRAAGHHRHRPEHLRGLARRRREQEVPEAAADQGRAVRAGLAQPALLRHPGPAVQGACQELLRADDGGGLLLPAARLSGGREPLPAEHLPAGPHPGRPGPGRLRAAGVQLRGR